MLKTTTESLLTTRFPNEPAWFTDLRKQALQKLRVTKDPRFAKVNYINWGLGELQAPVQPKRPINKPSSDAYIYCSLAEALQRHEKLLKTYFMKRAITDLADRLISFSTAYMNCGNFIYLPANTKLTAPIFVNQIEHDPHAAEVSHNFIIMDRGAQATICVMDEARQPTETKHCVSEIVLEENSQLNLVNIDAFTSKAAYINRQAWVGENAKLTWTIGSFSSGNVLAEMNAELVGRRSVATINNGAITVGKQIQGMNTQVTNFAPHSIGNIRQRGVIMDQSRLVFNGIGKIIHGAHGTIAQQENRVLMLSDQASGDANPILLIDENDVVAGHAASVGRLDKKQLYYLMSRGLSKPIAKKLVVRGFIGTFAKEITHLQIRKKFQDVLERKLAHDN